jgi:hypothetical protein
MAQSQYLRETSDEELRARARARVARTARTGRAPRDAFQADELAWAFEGHEAELDQLAQETADALAAEAAHQEAVERARTLQAETDRVLTEWDAERRKQAEAEARSRLGWEAE